MIGLDGREVTTPDILDNKYDNFRIGRTDTFTIEGLEAVGELKCVVLKAGGSDKWRFDYIQIKSTSHPEYVKFDNSDKIWMSSDTGEGSSILIFCVEE